MVRLLSLIKTTRAAWPHHASNQSGSSELMIVKRIIVKVIAAAAFCCVAFILKSQPVQCATGGTVALTCAQACYVCDLDGFTGNAGGAAVPGEVPPGFCTNIVHHPGWVGFVAGSTDLTLEISVSNCVGGNMGGLEAGIYSGANCSGYTLVSNCNSNIQDGTSALITTNAPLVIGNFYWLVLDGNGINSCDFTIDVMSGSAAMPPPGTISAVVGPTNVCVGNNAIFSVGSVFMADQYNWTVDGAPAGSGQSANISFPNAGDFEVCITVENACGASTSLCKTVTVTDIPPTDVSEFVCDGGCFTAPNGNQYCSSGSFQVIFPGSFGCDSLVNYIVEVNPPIFTQLEVALCEGETYTLGSEVFDQTGVYSVPFNSYRGCDSIVELTLNITPITNTFLNEQICAGDSYTVGDQTFTSSGFYPVLLEGFAGCDSLVFLDLLVTPTLVTNLTVSICAGQNYTVGSQVFNSSGNYQVILPSAASCDSIVNLSLTVTSTLVTNLTVSICAGQNYTVGSQVFNSSGNYQVLLNSSASCDSIVNLNLTVAPTPITNLTASICPGQNYTVGSQVFNSTGNYQVLLNSSASCDSIVNLNLTVTPTPVTNLTVSICPGQNYTVGSQIFNSAGNYQVLLNSAAGCDSTVNLSLTVKPTPVTNLTASICPGQNYSVGSQVFNSAGNYQVLLNSAAGCDSTVNLNLTVKPTPVTNLTASICPGQNYSVGSQVFNSAGNYQVLLNSAAGCDSTVNLNLTITPTPVTNLTASICPGQNYTVGSQVFNSAGNYQVLLTSAAGCDSTVNLNLTVTTNIQTNLTASICPGQNYTVGSQVFNSSGNYQVLLNSAAGCDSTVNLSLTVTSTLVTNLTVSICAGQNYTVGSQVFNSTGNYQVLLNSAAGCDSTVNLNLTVTSNIQTNLTASICPGQNYTVGSQVFNSTGNYQVLLNSAAGCDSTVNLNLTVTSNIQTNLTASICPGQNYTVGSQVFNSTGNYQVLLNSAAGCDSTVNLNLTVTSNIQTNLTASICPGQNYTVGSQVFNSTGNYQVLLSSSAGCDSTVNLSLTVTPTPVTNLTASICPGQNYTVGSQVFNSTGNYQVLLTSAAGCDSTVNLNLTVISNIQTNLTASICPGQNYSVGSQLFNSAGIYPVLLTSAAGCDSMVNLSLIVTPTPVTNLTVSICPGQNYTVGSQVFNSTGNYQVLL
jgi:hypothetical protein